MVEPRMSKQQMIEAIRENNPSADAKFLSAFDETALESYLTRLTEICGRRGPGSIWVRRGDTSAIVTRIRT